MGDLFGPTPGQQQAKRYVGQGVGAIQKGQGVLEGSPAFQGALSTGTNWAQHPLSLSPQVVQGMKQGGFDSASQGFQGALNDIGERMGALGLYRSGGTNTQFQHAASDFGGHIADVNRQIDTQAALQRNTDFTQMINSVLQLMQAQQQPYRDTGQIYAGQSLNPILNQPSQGAQIAGGLGSLAGGVLGGGTRPWWL